MDVDWNLAGRIARAAAGDAGASSPPAMLDARAAAARDQVVAATGLQPVGDLPAVEWVDRSTWIDANLSTMRAILDPVLDRGMATGPAALRAAAGAVVAAEIGGLIGLFSRRVLGQYEVNLLDREASPRLLLVGPNLDRATEELDVNRDELVTWVTLHEITHAVQFGSVTWLRPSLGGALREMLSALDVKPDPRGLLSLGLDDVRQWADHVREGGLLGAVIGADRRALLDHVQGTMGLVEGHAEWTMDRAGVEVLHDVERLRAAMDRRREDRAPLLRILDRLLGFDLKLKQYAQGRRFCDAVVAARGEDGLRDVWVAAELVPTPNELAMPARWLARTGTAAA